MMQNLYLYCLVFVSGAAVLAIEILGTRILGPYYGVSLFLWSALIAVTLIALSVGYTIGGRWADKAATMRRLSIIISIAGAWILLIPWIKQPVLLLADPFGMRFAVLLAAFVLFAPPLTLLGIVSPYAIKLRTKSLREVGSTAGNIFAISTIASVISALLTGYFLIPNIGVRLLTIIIGIILLISASIGLAIKRNLKITALFITAILLLGTLLFLKLPRTSDSKLGLLAVEQSPYAEIRVIDRGNLRHLVIDGGIHTIVDSSTWKSNPLYISVLELTKLFFDRPGKLLLIGLGGGSVVKNFVKDGWNVEVVEIDPVVKKIAYKYFGLDPSEAIIHLMDGRRFLSTRTGNYDVIVMDAYGSSYVPFHLVTEEAFGLLASRLKPDGILAVNLLAIGWRDEIVKSLYVTLEQHFKEVYSLPTEKSPNELQSIILLASNRKLNDTDAMLGRQRDYPDDANSQWYMQRANQAWDNRFIPETENKTPLTDDLNPIDLHAEAISIIVRKRLHRYFGNKGLDW